MGVRDEQSISRRALLGHNSRALVDLVAVSGTGNCGDSAFLSDVSAHYFAVLGVGVVANEMGREGER